MQRESEPGAVATGPTLIERRASVKNPGAHPHQWLKLKQDGTAAGSVTSARLWQQ